MIKNCGMQYATPIVDAALHICVHRWNSWNCKGDDAYKIDTRLIAGRRCDTPGMHEQSRGRKICGAHGGLLSSS
jgi:hypothetical protein